MAENKCSCGSVPNVRCVGEREMVCIETNRILDSCRDRDCFENVRVKLTDFGRDILDRAGSVRVKDACIAWTNITIDPVRFNRGFYQVTIRFYVKLTFEACVGSGRAQEFEGVAVVEKKVVLWGSESNVSVFRSTGDANDYCAVPSLCCPTRSVPTAVVEAVEPIVLDTRIAESKGNVSCCCCCVNEIPEHVQNSFGGCIVDDEDSDHYLVVSLGFFSVIRLVRPGQYLVQATEYCVPDKTCVCTEEDDPCSVFRSMAFPTAEFCPPSFTSKC